MVSVARSTGRVAGVTTVTGEGSARGLRSKGKDLKEGLSKALNLQEIEMGGGGGGGEIVRHNTYINYRYVNDL